MFGTCNGKDDVFGRIVDDPESPAKVFFAVFPALDAVWDCAEQVVGNLSDDRKARHWGHPTDVRDNENLMYWMKGLREWLADERTKALKQEYILPFAKAAALFDEITPGEEVFQILQVIQGLQDAQESMEVYAHDLAERAFGQWGAHFFMECQDDLPSDWFDCDPRALANIAVLHSAPATATGVFVPTAFQSSILKALQGRALKKMPLAAMVCGGEENGNLLYRPGGIVELRQCGLVDHKHGVGFYRPDSPPKESVAAV